MDRIPGKLGKRLSKVRIQHIALVGAGLFVIGGISFIGTTDKPATKAASIGTMYLAPASGTVAPGSNITVTIREESGSNPVYSVQSALKYNASQLQFVSVAAGTAFPLDMKTSTETPGSVKMLRSINNGGVPVSGDQVIATVTFRVLASSGLTSITIDEAESLIVSATTADNIMTSSVAASYTVAYPAPTVNTVSPATGSIGGGTSLTINGSNFRSGATVTVGGTPATNVMVVSPSQITAVAPAHAAGAVSVVVANTDGQQATKTSAYTYVAPAPTVTTVSPATGPLAGGTAITVTGSSFVSGATVRVDNVAAINVRFVSATSITANTPALSSAGAKSVTVTNPDGQSVTKAAAFTYNLPAPTISSLSATSDFTTGGKSITITGSNFVAGATVSFGAIAGQAVGVVNPTTITVTAPPSDAGVFSVTVRNTDGQSATLSDSFTYRVLGDANGDNRVNALDYTLLRINDGKVYPAGDFDKDGTIGDGDLAIMLSRWTW